MDQQPIPVFDRCDECIDTIKDILMRAKEGEIHPEIRADLEHLVQVLEMNSPTFKRILDRPIPAVLNKWADRLRKEPGR